MKPPSILSIRGGSWVDYAGGCRLAYRVRRPMEPFFILDSVGFRVVCLPPEVKPTQVAIRGGSHARLNYSWCRSTWCRSACRGVCHLPGYSDDDIGFRVIRLPPS